MKDKDKIIALKKIAEAYEVLVNKQYEVLKVYEDNMPVGFLKYMRDQMNMERRDDSSSPIKLEFLDELKMKLNLLQVISDRTDEIVKEQERYLNGK
jgi:DnaJ-domain-containing protein 1|tara:strand:+ start:975 stop:1262 length:288 start_codon:yes stop_codon:yes gene_type:complete